MTSLQAVVGQLTQAALALHADGAVKRPKPAPKRPPKPPCCKTCKGRSCTGHCQF
jgi:hypothetical protein